VAVSALEDMLALQLRACGLQFRREYRFHPRRRWRFDFAWPERLVAVEVQGGIWVKSGHTTGTGIRRDIEKHNAAVMMGWRVLYATRDMIESGEALRVIADVLEG